MRSRLVLFAYFLVIVALLMLLICAPEVFAQEPTASDGTSATLRVFDLVLPSEHLLGDWGGVRSELEERGITPRWVLITDVAGNPSGGRWQGATQASSTELSLFFDLDKIAGLKGGSVFMSMSQSWGSRLSSADVGKLFRSQK